MSAPSPDVIGRLIEDMRSKLLTVNVDYGFLFSSAWQKSRHGEGGRVATGHDPDLSDLMIGDVDAIRRYVRQSANELFQAYRKVQIAQARLNDVASVLDSRMPVVPEQLQEAITHPADRGDVERAKKAQDRRQDRATNRATPWARDEVSG